MLILTLGCSAVYASAMALKSVLPGSPAVICHQSIATGSAAADASSDADGAAAAGAAAGAAAAGAGLPPFELHALITRTRTVSIETRRQRFDTSRLLLHAISRLARSGAV